MIVSHLEIIPIDVLDQSAIATHCAGHLVSFNSLKRAVGQLQLVTVVPLLQAGEKLRSMRFFRIYVF